MGHFPSRSVVEMPDIQSALRLIIFSVFRLKGDPNLSLLPNFPACGSLKASFGQLSFCGRLKLSKAGKDYESAAEGRECFLKEVCKDKKDGVNLSG